MFHQLMYHFFTPNHEYLTRLYSITCLKNSLIAAPVHPWRTSKRNTTTQYTWAMATNTPTPPLISLNDSTKFTILFLTNVVVNLMSVVELQCYSLTVLTTAVWAIPAPFTSTVRISETECHTGTHSCKSGLI